MMATTGRPNDHYSSTALLQWSTQPVNGTTKTNPPSTLEDYHSGLIALTVLIIICNLFAIQTYKRHEKIRRNCSNVLLLSLAISDLVVGVVYIPILIYCENQWTKRAPDNKTFITICRVNYLFGNFSGFSTIFHVIALTLEKYLAVLHPFQRLSVSTTSTYRKILVTVWLLALVFAMAPLFWLYDNPLSPSWVYKFRVYAVVQAVVFLGLASGILMYCYIRMFFQIHTKLSEHTQTGRVQTKARNDRKTVVIFLMFFTIFIAGWSPWFFFNLKREHEELVSLEVKDFLISLRFAGAVLNPLLYTFIKNDYKQAVQSDLRGLCSSCPRPIGFHELVQSSTLNRKDNNGNTRRSTLTTAATSHDTNDVKLKKIKPPAREPESSASAGTDIHFSSHAEDSQDTDL